MTYFNWAVGQPDSGPNENCMFMHVLRTPDKIHDAKCGGIESYVCGFTCQP